MPKLSVTLFVATLSLAGAAMFADAQTAPKPKQPATKAAPNSAPEAPAAGTCPHGPCEMAAADKPSAERGGMMMMHSPHGDRHARHRELAALADIKVQNTKLGATIQLVAKNATDATKVQELAKDLAASLSEPHEHAHPRHPH